MAQKVKRLLPANIERSYWAALCEVLHAVEHMRLEMHDLSARLERLEEIERLEFARHAERLEELSELGPLASPTRQESQTPRLRLVTSPDSPKGAA